MELTVESMGRRLATGGADEIARIRREVQNNQGALQRRIEEVTTWVEGLLIGDIRYDPVERTSSLDYYRRRR